MPYDTAKTRLTSQRGEIVAQLVELGATESGDLGGEVDFGEGFADAATATAERTELLGIIDALVKRLAEVDAALARITDGTYGRWDKTFNRFIPAIRGPSLLATASPAYLEANIAQGRPGTQMPGWEAQAGGLLPAEITALVDYLRRGAPRPIPSVARVTRGDASRGGVLFAQNCAGCHGPAGRGGVAPELANPTFQQAASDEFIVTTIRLGRQGTAMPSFQRPGAAALTNAEIGDLLGFIRTLAGGGGEATRAQAREQAGPAGGAP